MVRHVSYPQSVLSQLYLHSVVIVVPIEDEQSYYVHELPPNEIRHTPPVQAFPVISSVHFITFT